MEYEVDAVKDENDGYVAPGKKSFARKWINFKVYEKHFRYEEQSIRFNLSSHLAIFLRTFNLINGLSTLDCYLTIQDILANILAKSSIFDPFVMNGLIPVTCYLWWIK